MSPESKPNRLLKYGIPLVATLALIFALSRIGRSGSEANTFTADALPTATAGLPDSSPLESTSSTSSNEGGVIHPYTGVFYPRATNFAGLKDWDCFIIPAGGTSYGAILVGGANERTTSDTQEGIIFINGIPYSFPADSDPNTWPPETWHVQPGDIGCSQ